MRCYHCGAEIPDGSRFCRECGNRLLDIQGNNSGWTYEEEGNPRYSKPADEVVLNSCLDKPQAPQPQKTKKKSSIIWAWIVVLIIIAAIFPSKKSQSNQNSSTQTPAPTNDVSATQAPKTNYTIEKDTEYAFMSDQWNVYIAKAISDSMIKIEHWDKTLSSTKKLSYSEDIGTFRINDPENGFAWVDKEHTAFSFIFSDDNNSNVRTDKSHFFTININEGDKFKGTDYNENIVCYAYKNDDWHMYRAIPLNDHQIKFECWARNSSADSFCFGWDWGILDLNWSSSFEWVDEEHTGFTITVKDPNNESYWKEEKLVFFSNENPKYKYSSIAAFLGRTETISTTTAQSAGTPLREKLYPVHIGELAKYAAEAPDAVFSSPAEENGLEGNYYYLVGKVKEYTSIENPDSNLGFTLVANSFVLSTKHGDVLITDAYTPTMEYLKTHPEEVGDNYEAVYAAYYEPKSDYSFPAIGDEVKVVGVYNGLSEKYKMPSFYYGYPNFILLSKLAELLQDDASDDNSSEVPYTTEPTPAPTPTPTPTPTKKPEFVDYSTNDKSTVKNGNSGIYAYKSHGGSYDNYWVIDFDNGYVYNFQKGNGNSLCDRVKIDSGDLNSVVIITYHDGSDKWQYGLHFKWARQPDHLILQDNDGFEYDFYTTNLENALTIRDTMRMVDY